MPVVANQPYRHPEGPDRDLESLAERARACASVFYKDENDQVFHTYSFYERGLGMFVVA